MPHATTARKRRAPAKAGCHKKGGHAPGAPAVQRQAGSKEQASLGSQYSAGPVRRLGIQTKLTVGRAGDAYEREADDVAERVASGQPAGDVSRIPAGGLAAQRKADENSKATAQSSAQREDDAGEGDGAPTAQRMSDEKAQQKSEDKTQRQDDEGGKEEDAQAKCDRCEKEEKGQRKEEGDTPDSQAQRQDDKDGGAAEDAQTRCAACSDEANQSVQRQSANTGGAASTDSAQTAAGPPGESSEVPVQRQEGGQEAASEGGEEGAAQTAGAADPEMGPECDPADAGESEEAAAPEQEEHGEELGCGESEGEGGAEGGAEGAAPAAGEGGQSCGGGEETAAEGTEAGGAGPTEGEPSAEADPDPGAGAPVPGCAAASVESAGSSPGESRAESAPTTGEGGAQQAGSECGTAQRKEDESAGDEGDTPQAAQRQEDEGGDDAAQARRSSDPVKREGLDTATASRLIHARGAGEPLKPNVKHRLEHSLGVDVNGIRVHCDSNAHAANRALRAKAFTHRNHIFLGPGQSQHDMNLMAHEGTHVLQQDGIARRKPAEGDAAGVGGEAGPTKDAPMPDAGMPRTGRGSSARLSLSPRAERDAPPPRAESGPPPSGPSPRPMRARAVTGIGSAVPPAGLGTAASVREEMSGVAQVGAAPPATNGALAMAAPVRPGTMALPPVAKGAAVRASAIKGAPPPPAKRSEGETPIPRGGKAVDGKAGGKTRATAMPAKGKAASRKALPVLQVPSLPAPASIELPEPIAATPPAATSAPVAQGPGQRYDTFRARASVDELVAGLGDAAEEHKSVHRERAATAKARMADDGRQQKSSALGAASQTGQDIDNSLQGARSAIAAHATAFKALTPLQALTGWTQVLGATSEQVGQLQKSKQDQQAAARLQVTRHQEEARKFGADEGKRGSAAIIAQAQEATDRGETKASGYTADEKGRVQANAVRSVAAKVSAELMKPAQTIHDEAVKQGNKLADGLAGSADSAIASMDEQAQAVAGQLSVSAMEQLPSFLALGLATGQAIDQLVVQVNAQLDTVDTESRAQLGLVRLGLDTQFDTAVRAGHTAVDNQLVSVDAATDTIVRRAMKTARGLTRPDPDRVRQALRSVDGLLGQASEGFDEGLGEMERTSADSFGQAGTAATTQLVQVSRSTRGHLAQVVQAATGGTTALFKKQIEEQDKALEKWKEGLTEAQTGVDVEWAKEVKQVGDHLDEGVKKGKAPITKGVDDSVKKNGEVLAKLDGQMQEAAEDALYRYEHPIRAKLKAAFWGALKALGMLVLIVGLFFVGLALLIVGLISGAIALVVVGILILATVVGFVIYGLISGIVNRIRSATSVGGMIAGFFVGILDITGIPNIIEGITEKDIISGRQLTLEEAGDRLGGGIVGLVTLIIPFAKGAKGRAPKMPLEVAPEVAPKLPVEAPTPRVEPPAPKVEPPPVEPPRLEPPRVEPPVEPPVAEPRAGERTTAQPPKAEPPTAQQPKAEPPTVQPPKAEPPKTEPPKTEPPTAEPKPELPRTEPARGKRETKKSAAELETQLEKDGLTIEEIQGFFHDLDASQLSPSAAGRVRTLRSHFTTKDLKALGQYLYDNNRVLNEARVRALIDDVKPGEMGAFLSKADTIEVLGGAKRRPGAKTEGSVLQDPKARAEVTDKPSPGRVPAPFERGNFVHRFAEHILNQQKLPRPSEAEVVVQVRNARGEIVPGKIIRTDRMIRDTRRGLLIEIKPRGKSAAKGREQLPARLDALQNQYPKPEGWTGRVVTYSRREVEQWLRSQGVSATEMPVLMKELGFE